MKHFYKDQRGVGHLGLILVVVVVLALGGVGYFVFTKNKGGYSNDTIRAALENAKCDYDDEDLCKFFTGWKALGYYDMEATTEADGQTSTMSVKTEGDDKSHVKLSGEMTWEVITIGSVTYTKAADGTWWKQTQTTADAPSYTEDAKVAFDEPSATETADKTSYKKLGEEKCGDLNCFKYQVIDPSDTEHDSYIWFDDKDFQLRRTQTLSKDGKTKFNATFSYSDAKISEPSPVKELGPNQYLVPGATEPTTIPSAEDTSGMTAEELQQLMEMYGSE